MVGEIGFIIMSWRGNIRLPQEPRQPRSLALAAVCGEAGNRFSGGKYHVRRCRREWAESKFNSISNSEILMPRYRYLQLIIETTRQSCDHWRRIAYPFALVSCSPILDLLNAPTLAACAEVTLDPWLLFTLHRI